MEVEENSEILCIATKGMSPRKSVNTSQTNTNYGYPISRSGSRYGQIMHLPIMLDSVYSPADLMSLKTDWMSKSRNGACHGLSSYVALVAPRGKRVSYVKKNVQWNHYPLHVVVIAAYKCWCITESHIDVDLERLSSLMGIASLPVIFYTQ